MLAEQINLHKRVRKFIGEVLGPQSHEMKLSYCDDLGEIVVG